MDTDMHTNLRKTGRNAREFFLKPKGYGQRAHNTEQDSGELFSKSKWPWTPAAIKTVTANPKRDRRRHTTHANTYTHRTTMHYGACCRMTCLRMTVMMAVGVDNF